MSLHDTQTRSVEEKQIADFLASHGGSFYELQARLRLLSADGTRRLRPPRDCLAPSLPSACLRS